MQANEPVDSRVRRRLRELRTERGLTLQQVAEKASIDVSTLSRLEAGKRRPDQCRHADYRAPRSVTMESTLTAGTPSSSTT